MEMHISLKMNNKLFVIAGNESFPSNLDSHQLEPYGFI